MAAGSLDHYPSQLIPVGWRLTGEASEPLLWIVTEE